MLKVRKTIFLSPRHFWIPLEPSEVVLLPPSGLQLSVRIEVVFHDGTREPQAAWRRRTVNMALVSSPPNPSSLYLCVPSTLITGWSSSSTPPIRTAFLSALARRKCYKYQSVSFQPSIRPCTSLLFFHTSLPERLTLPVYG